MLRHIFLTAILLALPLSALADDTTPAFPRTLAAEPEYAAAPKYFVLLFGEEDPLPVWCAWDSEVLFADIDGDGNLTEEGERFEPDPNAGFDFGGYPAEGGVFRLGDVTDRAGIIHRGVSVQVRIPIQFPEQGAIQIEALCAGEHEMTASIAHDDLLHSLETAPYRRFGGPLHPQPLNHILELRQGPLPTEVTFLLETAAAPGQTGAVISYRGIPREALPLAHVSVPRAGGETTEWEVIISDRCCENQYYGEIAVPPGVPTGPATLTLSFPACQVLEIEPATYQVEIVAEDAPLGPAALSDPAASGQPTGP